MTDHESDYHHDYVAAWNDHDPGRVVAQFARGGTYVDPTLEDPLVEDEIGEYVSDVATAFPDLHVEDRRTTATGAGVVHEWTMVGTHAGPLEGLPPTGNSIALDGVDIVTITEDGIASVRGYFDRQTFAEQLGLTFPEVIGQVPTLAVGMVAERL